MILSHNKVDYLDHGHYLILQQFHIESKSNNSWTISETLCQTILVFTEGELTFSSPTMFDWIVNIPRPPGKRYSRSWWPPCTWGGAAWCHLRSLIREAIIFVINLYSNQKLFFAILIKIFDVIQFQIPKKCFLNIWVT